MTGRGGPRPGWKRDTALFLAGQTTAMFGALVVDFAVVWHLVLTTESGTVLMWSTVFAMLPQAVLSPFGGVWADRLSRKLLVIGSTVAVAIVSLTLAFALLQGIHDLWIIYLTLAVRSAFGGIQTPAARAVLPQIVPADQLLRINGVNQALQSALMLTTPGAAAAVYAAAGIHTVFFLDVATAVVGILLLTAVPIARAVTVPEAAARGSYVDDLRDGLRYIARHASLRWLMLLLGVLLLLAGAPMLLTTLMVARTFGGEVWMVSGNEIAWGLGGLLGGLAMAALAHRLTNRVLVIVASVVASAVMTVLLGLATNLWVFYAFGLLLAFALAFETNPTTTILQETVEPEMQGRVFGLYSVVVGTAMPLSMVVFGPLADHFSVESLLIVAGAALLAFMLALLAIPATRTSLSAIGRPAPA